MASTRDDREHSRSADSLQESRTYYDESYYQGPAKPTIGMRHNVRLAKSIVVDQSDAVLDVACGTGGFLRACSMEGASIAGVDISENAIERGKHELPSADLRVSPAEQLPFLDATFTVVSCLGALEHFVDPGVALSEIRRVATGEARFLFLVPNADFLPRSMGLFHGTEQREHIEDARTLDEWTDLFMQNGFHVKRVWRDLHCLSKEWVLNRGRSLAPFRLMSAGAIALLPLRRQYQIYYLCVKAD